MPKLSITSIVLLPRYLIFHVAIVADFTFFVHFLRRWLKRRSAPHHPHSSPLLRSLATLPTHLLICCSPYCDTHFDTLIAPIRHSYPDLRISLCDVYSPRARPHPMLPDASTPSTTIISSFPYAYIMVHGEVGGPATHFRVLVMSVELVAPAHGPGRGPAHPASLSYHRLPLPS